MDSRDIMAALEETLRQEGEITLPAAGLSMQYSLGRAEALVIRPAATTPIRRGSIIVFKRHGRWIAHRVVWKTINNAGLAEYLTKGDSTWAFDRPVVSSEEVVGVVTAMRTNGRIVPFRGGTVMAMVGLAIAVAAGFFQKRDC